MRSAKFWKEDRYMAERKPGSSMFTNAENYNHGSADRPFSLEAKAWAVRGVVP
jgi:hypothetical protein